MNNPFSFGVPILDPSHFIGRDDEIRQIVNRLLSSGHDSTSVVGPRRMGKSSLLQRLSNPLTAINYGLDITKYILVYIDLQGSNDITPFRLWKRILQQIQNNISVQSIIVKIKWLLQQDSIDRFDLEDIFDSIKNERLHLVLFLDEFESITLNKNFSYDFFGGLRSLACMKPLSMVTASQCELIDICYSDEIKSSPFFNIFASVLLRPFNNSHMEAFFTKFSDLSSPYPLSAIDKHWLKTLGGTYPFYLQMAGFYLFEAKQLYKQDKEANNHASNNSIYYYLVNNFDHQASAHFRYMWDHCSEKQKITLLVILILCKKGESRKAGPRLEEISRIFPQGREEVTKLIDKGVILDMDQHLTLFSNRLGIWIVSEIIASPEEEDQKITLQDWLKKGGVKDIENAYNFMGKFKRKYWPTLLYCLQQLSFGVAGNALYQLLRDEWLGILR
jgi:hypothetical protein